MKELSKSIRFIDKHFNTLFYIPDGSQIEVVEPDGKSGSLDVSTSMNITLKSATRLIIFTILLNLLKMAIKLYLH